MFTAPDFSKKQIVFVFFNEGEKLALSNSNLVVRREDGSIKFQCTCYRLFLVFAVGHCSLTSAILQEAKKMGFFIALMTPGFRLYGLVGAEKEGNILLHRKQYAYDDLSIARHITENKIGNQISGLKGIRNKNDSVKEAIMTIGQYRDSISGTETLNELMAYEGLSSKLYFRNYYNNTAWNGRQPRIKRDPINSTLDIGYTLLFTFIDALLESFGFDTFCGVMHTQFYMRKSLVCDLVEPFRSLIDHAVRNGIALRQIQEDDFLLINGQYRLKWKESSRYVKFLLEPILSEKDVIFSYIQEYYRAFMKGLPADSFPYFDISED